MTAPAVRTPLEGLDFHVEHADRTREFPVERSLVRRRHDVFSEVDWERGSGERERPAVDRDAVRINDRVAEVDAADFTTGSIATGLAISGCLIVRGLLERSECADLSGCIDKSLAARDGGDRGPWFSPFGEDLDLGNMGMERVFSEDSGSMFAADSPRVFRSICAAFRNCGLADVVADWFGGRPAISARKCALWRVRPDLAFADWHQDGAFMGRDIQTLNTWFALSDCGAGTSAPGIDLVPVPKAEFAPTGTGGAMFDWSVSNAHALVAAGEQGPAHPTFSAGDALIFDERLLHRTATRPGLAAQRYALETWWFPTFDFPPSQIPLVF